MLHLTENDKNLGTLSVNTPLQFSVGVKNPSREKITVNNVQPGCGSCTAAMMENAEIPAGGTGTLKITFTPNTTAFQTTKSVRIDYSGSDLVRHSITFNFSAKVI